MKDDNSSEDFTDPVVDSVRKQVDVDGQIAAAIRKLKGATEGDLICDRCGCEKATINRQMTYYEEDASNWQTLCPPCQEESDENWNQMWKEYYGSIM